MRYCVLNISIVNEIGLECNSLTFRIKVIFKKKIVIL